eukprot:366131-Chlamydomonas_euryale.AAC.17
MGRMVATPVAMGICSAQWHGQRCANASGACGSVRTGVRTSGGAPHRRRNRRAPRRAIRCAPLSLSDRSSDNLAEKHVGLKAVVN